MHIEDGKWALHGPVHGLPSKVDCEGTANQNLAALYFRPFAFCVARHQDR
jgi:hypothetical protein